MKAVVFRWLRTWYFLVGGPGIYIKAIPGAQGARTAHTWSGKSLGMVIAKKDFPGHVGAVRGALRP